MNNLKLIEENKLLIYKIARKFYNIDINDLFQAGCIGIIKASKHFIDNGECKFSTFAYKYIFGEMYELANSSRDIKLNKMYLKSAKVIEKARSILTQTLERTPTIDEISLYTEFSPEFIESVLITTKDMISLDEEYNEYDNESTNLYNKLGIEEDIDTKILVRDSLNELEEPMKSIINYRYFHDLTQSEIAELMGLSQVKVSRLETKGKKKIKEYIDIAA